MQQLIVILAQLDQILLGNIVKSVTTISILKKFSKLNKLRINFKSYFMNTYTSEHLIIGVLINILGKHRKGLN